MSIGLEDASVPATLTPDFTEVIVEAIKAALYDLHTGLPAKVVSFDPATQSCSVQPLLKRAFLNDDEQVEVVSIPIIYNVPVAYPAGAGWSITWPLLPGDPVFLAFAERSLEIWKQTPRGTEIDPKDSRKHALSDAIAKPELRTRPDAIPGISSTNLRIANDAGTVVLELSADAIRVQAPTVALDAGGTADSPIPRGLELLAYLQALSVWLQALTLPVSGAAAGPPSSPPPPVPATLLSTTATVR